MDQGVLVLLLWLLWKASNFLVTKILIIGPSNEYINDQLTLISNENATAQEEIDLFEICKELFKNSEFYKIIS